MVFIRRSRNARIASLAGTQTAASSPIIIDRSASYFVMEYLHCTPITIFCNYSVYALRALHSFIRRDNAGKIWNLHYNILGGFPQNRTFETCRENFIALDESIYIAISKRFITLSAVFFFMPILYYLQWDFWNVFKIWKLTNRDQLSNLFDCEWSISTIYYFYFLF